MWKFEGGDRVIWATGDNRRGTIQGGQIEKAIVGGNSFIDQYQYVVLWDNNIAMLIGEGALKPEYQCNYCPACGSKLEQDC